MQQCLINISEYEIQLQEGTNTLIIHEPKYSTTSYIRYMLFKRWDKGLSDILSSLGEWGWGECLFLNRVPMFNIAS